MRPQCEIEYHKLQNRVSAFRASLDNKKVFLDGVDRLLTAFLGLMETEGSCMIPKNTAFLYRLAGVRENVFERNFGTLSGFILVVQGLISEEINNHLSMFTGLPIDITLNRLFDYIICKDVGADPARQTRIRFAIKRFGVDFWKPTLHSLFPVLSAEWKEYDSDAQDFLFELYVNNMLIVLRRWEQAGFSERLIPYCKQMLILLNTKTMKQINDLANALFIFKS